MILGITGPIAAGKGTLSALLHELGFSIYSLSDVLRNELQKRGLSTDRHIITPFSNKMRAEHGADFLAKGALEEIRASGDTNVAIESVRNPHEVETLKEAGVIMIGINADPRIRFERIVARARKGDPQTYEEFIQDEEAENTSGDNNQQLDVCYKMADHFIDNTGSPEELREKLLALLDKLQWKK